MSSGGSYFSSLVTLHHRSLHCVTPNHCHARIKSYREICRDVMFLLFECIPKLNKTEDWSIASLTQCDTDLSFTIKKKILNTQIRSGIFQNPQTPCFWKKRDHRVYISSCLNSFNVLAVVPWRKHPLFLDTESRWLVRMNPNLCWFSLTSIWFVLKIISIENHSAIRYHGNVWRFFNKYFIIFSECTLSSILA